MHLCITSAVLCHMMINHFIKKGNKKMPTLRQKVTNCKPLAHCACAVPLKWMENSRAKKPSPNSSMMVTPSTPASMIWPLHLTLWNIQFFSLTLRTLALQEKPGASSKTGTPTSTRTYASAKQPPRPSLSATPRAQKQIMWPHGLRSPPWRFRPC